ncbi:MAG: helix-turn-helix transcriptional regulator [Pseudomonadota bacterium]
MKHWTERSVDDFLYRIAADFVAQLETKIHSESLNKADLAQKLGISKGRVSQILNNPGNLSLKTIIKFARALGMKIAIVAYDDKDHENERGPINSEIFRICWENSGKPADFWALEESQCVATSTATVTLFPNSQIWTCTNLAGARYAATVNSNVGQYFKVPCSRPDNVVEFEDVVTTAAFGQNLGRTLH